MTREEFHNFFSSQLKEHDPGSTPMVRLKKYPQNADVSVTPVACSNWAGSASF
jgi:hypothetical protein